MVFLGSLLILTILGVLGRVTLSTAFWNWALITLTCSLSMRTLVSSLAEFAFSVTSYCSLSLFVCSLYWTFSGPIVGLAFAVVAIVPDAAIYTQVFSVFVIVASVFVMAVWISTTLSSRLARRLHA